MKNFIQVRDEKNKNTIQIALSEETAENIRKQFGKKEDLIDEEIGYLRVSETGKGRTSYPVRISILDGSDEGLPMEEFGLADDGSLPGYTMGISNAKRFRDTLDRIIQKHKKDC